MRISGRALEAELVAGELRCPDCAGLLRPWGFAREREVRLLAGVRCVRPRRALCRRCGATHVVCPAFVVPRRRDGAEVIGEALRQAAVGAGHRTIARRLQRPEGTVRGWLRAGRRRSEQLRCCGTRWAIALDPELGAIEPTGSPLSDAVEALAVAARAWVLRFGPQVALWELIVWLTNGLLHAECPIPP